MLALVLVAALPVSATLGIAGEHGAERALRIALIFVVLLAAFRVLGKRELGRLSPFELVTLMLIPEVLSNTVQGDGSLLEGLVGLSTLLLLVLATSLLAHRFPQVEKVLESPPTVLVTHGRLVEDALNRERILPDELFSEMHKQGIQELSELSWAILEPSGNITFVPRERTAKRGGGDDDEMH